MSKVMFKDREVLRINERYVEGYGWITEEQYQDLMYNPDPKKRDECPAGLFNKIRFYNVQYRLEDGKTGQMDIPTAEFWNHREFMPDVH